MYKKFRYFFRYFQAVLQKYSRFFALGAIFLLVAAFLLPRLISRLPAIRSVRRIALIGRYSLSDLPPLVRNQLSFGLTRLDESGQPVPGVASSWQATDSGRSYLFNLNNGLLWHDGTALKASDIKFSFRDAQIEYPDNRHLLIRLKDPYAPLPAVVTRPLIKSALFRTLFSRRSQLLGLGSYRLENYHGTGAYLDWLQLRPTSTIDHLPLLRYRFYSTDQQARTAFALGEVDEIRDLHEPGDLSSWKNIRVTSSVQTDRYIGVFFNTQHPDFAGPSGRNFRQSLAYAIDRSRWENRLSGPIPSTSWAYNPDLRRYDQDLDRSKLLLKKVEKIPSKIIISTVPAYLWVAEQVKADWQALGLSVEISASADIPDNYQVLLLAQALPPDPDQYNLWHSTVETTNLTRLKNPRIDKLLEDGRKTLDINQRKILYADFQKYLLEECPAAFLFYPQVFTISRH